MMTLQSVPNFRDVAEVVNDCAGKRLCEPGRLYRSARPDDASFQDRRRLVNEYGIKTIIDLRTKTEHIAQAQKRDEKIRSSAAAPQTNDETAEPLKIPGVTYHEINFNGNGFSRMLLSQLSWTDFLRLVTLMVFGYRNDAIKILAPTMTSMGLVGISKASIDVCKKEIRQVFDILVHEENYPVLVHCTQGKDRTGLVVMLALFALIPDRLDAIERDYHLSEAELSGEREGMVSEMAKVGLPPEFTNCPAGMSEQVLRHLEDAHGGIQRYFDGIGIDAPARDRLKRILLAHDVA